MQSEVEIVDLVDLDEDELPSKSAAFVPEIIECGDTSSEGIISYFINQIHKVLKTTFATCVLNFQSQKEVGIHKLQN